MRVQIANWVRAVPGALEAWHVDKRKRTHATGPALGSWRVACMYLALRNCSRLPCAAMSRRCTAAAAWRAAITSLADDISCSEAPAERR